MKRTQTFSLHQLLYFVLAITLTFTACKKGDAGPQGDKGDTGEKGSKGDKGDKGDGGTTVYYSAWKDVTFTLNQAGTAYIAELTDTHITSDIVSKGEVRIFVNFDSPADPTVSPLPYVVGTAQIRPFYWLNTIQLVANVDASTYTDSGVKYLQYRYIIIPGGQGIRTAVNWNDYAQVKAYLGLKD